MCVRLNATHEGNSSSSGGGQVTTFSSLDTSACWAQCFRGDNSHHAAFLDIVQTLQVGVQCSHSVVLQKGPPEGS